MWFYQKLADSCDSSWYTHILCPSLVCLMHVTVPSEPAQQPSLPGGCPQMVAQHDESQTEHRQWLRPQLTNFCADSTSH